MSPILPKSETRLLAFLLQKNILFLTCSQMLYASTRASLLKSLGSTLFTDSIFATSTADLTSEAYASHKRHVAAPKPLSAREQEMADIRAAESGGAYEGSRARASHIGTGVGLPWSKEVEDAVRDLGTGVGCAVVVVVILTQYLLTGTITLSLFPFRKSTRHLRPSSSLPPLKQRSNLSGHPYLLPSHVTRSLRGHMRIHLYLGEKSVRSQRPYI